MARMQTKSLKTKQIPQGVYALPASLGNFVLSDISYKDKISGCKQSEFLNLFTKVKQFSLQPTRSDTQLDLLFINKEEPAGVASLFMVTVK